MSPALAPGSFSVLVRDRSNYETILGDPAVRGGIIMNLEWGPER